MAEEYHRAAERLYAALLSLQRASVDDRARFADVFTVELYNARAIRQRHKLPRMNFIYALTQLVSRCKGHEHDFLTLRFAEEIGSVKGVPEPRWEGDLGEDRWWVRIPSAGGGGTGEGSGSGGEAGEGAGAGDGIAKVEPRDSAEPVLVRSSSPQAQPIEPADAQPRAPSVASQHSTQQQQIPTQPPQQPPRLPSAQPSSYHPTPTPPLPPSTTGQPTTVPSQGPSQQYYPGWPPPRAPSYGPEAYGPYPRPGHEYYPPPPPVTQTGPPTTTQSAPPSTAGPQAGPSAPPPTGYDRYPPPPGPPGHERYPPPPGHERYDPRYPPPPPPAGAPQDQRYPPPPPPASTSQDRYSTDYKGYPPPPGAERYSTQPPPGSERYGTHPPPGGDARYDRYGPPPPGWPYPLPPDGSRAGYPPPPGTDAARAYAASAPPDGSRAAYPPTPTDARTYPPPPGAADGSRPYRPPTPTDARAYPPPPPPGESSRSAYPPPDPRAAYPPPDASRPYPPPPPPSSSASYPPPPASDAASRYPPPDPSRTYPPPPPPPSASSSSAYAPPPAPSSQDPRADPSQRISYPLPDGGRAYAPPNMSAEMAQYLAVTFRERGNSRQEYEEWVSSLRAVGVPLGGRDPSSSRDKERRRAERERERDRAYAATYGSHHSPSARHGGHAYHTPATVPAKRKSSSLSGSGHAEWYADRGRYVESPFTAGSASKYDSSKYDTSSSSKYDASGKYGESGASGKYGHGGGGVGEPPPTKFARWEPPAAVASLSERLERIREADANDPPCKRCAYKDLVCRRGTTVKPGSHPKSCSMCRQARRDCSLALEAGARPMEQHIPPPALPVPLPPPRVGMVPAPEASPPSDPWQSIHARTGAAATSEVFLFPAPHPQPPPAPSSSSAPPQPSSSHQRPMSPEIEILDGPPPARTPSSSRIGQKDSAPVAMDVDGERRLVQSPRSMSRSPDIEVMMNDDNEPMPPWSPPARLTSPSQPAPGPSSAATSTGQGKEGEGEGEGRRFSHHRTISLPEAPVHARAQQTGRPRPASFSTSRGDSGTGEAGPSQRERAVSVSRGPSGVVEREKGRSPYPQSNIQQLAQPRGPTPSSSQHYAAPPPRPHPQQQQQRPISPSQRRRQSHLQARLGEPSVFVNTATDVEGSRDRADRAGEEMDSVGSAKTATSSTMTGSTRSTLETARRSLPPTTVANASWSGPGGSGGSGSGGSGSTVVARVPVQASPTTTRDTAVVVVDARKAATPAPVPVQDTRTHTPRQSTPSHTALRQPTPAQPQPQPSHQAQQHRPSPSHQHRPSPHQRTPVPLGYSWEQIQSDPALLPLKQAMEQGRIGYEYRAPMHGHYQPPPPPPPPGYGAYAHAQLQPQPIQTVQTQHQLPPTAPTVQQRTRMSTEPPEPGSAGVEPYTPDAPVPSQSLVASSTAAHLDPYLRPLSLAQPVLGPLVELLVQQDNQLRILTEAVEKLAQAQKVGNEELAAWRSSNMSAVKEEGVGTGERMSVDVGVQAGAEEEYDSAGEASMDISVASVASVGGSPAAAAAAGT